MKVDEPGCPSSLVLVWSQKCASLSGPGMLTLVASLRMLCMYCRFSMVVKPPSGAPFNIHAAPKHYSPCGNDKTLLVEFGVRLRNKRRRVMGVPVKQSSASGGSNIKPICLTLHSNGNGYVLRCRQNVSAAQVDMAMDRLVKELNRLARLAEFLRPTRSAQLAVEGPLIERAQMRETSGCKMQWKLREGKLLLSSLKSHIIGQGGDIQYEPESAFKGAKMKVYAKGEKCTLLLFSSCMVQVCAPSYDACVSAAKTFDNRSTNFPPLLFHLDGST